jgi:hypothetical protein
MFNALETGGHDGSFFNLARFNDNLSILMPADDFPPLAALRTFAHAARTGSFKDTAFELHLSPSAVSRQIQAL